MTVVVLFLILLIALMVGVLPVWPHSRHWGLVPSGGIGMVLLITLAAWMLDRM